jgi:glycopeptide antibiotics resistance protein
MLNSKRQKMMSRIVCGIYLILLVWLILFKLSTNFADLSHIRSINFIPFKGAMTVNQAAEFKEILYNIIVFIPLGVYVSVFKSDWSGAKRIALCLGASFIFEALQFIFAIGVSDITDLITNTLGGLIGIMAYGALRNRCKKNFIAIINSLGLAIEALAITMLGILLAANR